MYSNILTTLCMVLIIFLLVLSIYNPTMTTIVVILFLGILIFGYLTLRDQFKLSSQIN